MKRFPQVRICKQYAFSASHQLPNVPNGHPCGRLHGHNYLVEIEARGEIGLKSGWLVDFAELDKNMAPILDRLDHHHLNDVVENPTAEILAQWIMDQYPVKYIYRVRVWETPKCWAEVVNEDGHWTSASRAD